MQCQVMGWIRKGFTEACEQMLSADCEYGLWPSHMVPWSPYTATTYGENDNNALPCELLTRLRWHMRNDPFLKCRNGISKIVTWYYWIWQNMKTRKFVEKIIEFVSTFVKLPASRRCWYIVAKYSCLHYQAHCGRLLLLSPDVSRRGL